MYLRVAQIVSKNLQSIGGELILIIQYMIMSRPASTLQLKETNDTHIKIETIAVKVES